MCLLLPCLLRLLCSLRMTGRTTATPQPAGASCALNQVRLPPLLHLAVDADCLDTAHYGFVLLSQLEAVR
jgi:hypothetical protein